MPHADGYYVETKDGARHGWNDRHKCGAFPYFQDVARWVRDGGLEK